MPSNAPCARSAPRSSDELARDRRAPHARRATVARAVGEPLARRLRHGRLDALEAGFTRWADRRHDGAARAPIDEWREFVALRAAYDAAAAAGGLDLRRLAFPHAYKTGTAMAVWLWNARDEYALSHAISAWLGGEARIVGDAEAIEVCGRNTRLAVPTRHRQGRDALTRLPDEPRWCTTPAMKLIGIVMCLGLAGCFGAHGGVMMTPQVIQSAGTQTFHAPLDKVFAATASALKSEGFPIAISQPEKGFIKTGQKIIRTDAAGNALGNSGRHHATIRRDDPPVGRRHDRRGRAADLRGQRRAERASNLGS